MQFVALTVEVVLDAAGAAGTIDEHAADGSAGAHLNAAPPRPFEIGK